MSLEKPALNPTGGVKNKDPMDLDYQPDPNRPGGGVFVARGNTRQTDLKDLPQGTVIGAGSDDEETEGKALLNVNDHNSKQGALLFSSFVPPPLHNLAVNSGPIVSTHLGGTGSPSVPMVNFTPLGGNLNPAMNGESRPNNQVINLLDNAQTNTNAIQEYAMADSGYLEGLPNGMFEWGESAISANFS